MKESTLVKGVLDELNGMPECKAVKFHGSRFTEAGTPDIVGCFRGIPFLIECKVGRNEPTKIQAHRMRQWADAGAFVTVAREDFDVPAFIESLSEHS